MIKKSWRMGRFSVCPFPQPAMSEAHPASQPGLADMAGWPKQMYKPKISPFFGTLSPIRAAAQKAKRPYTHWSCTGGQGQ